MSTEKKIFTNTLSLTLGKALGDVASFVFLIYFARVFGTSFFGQYAFAMSLGGFLTIIVGLGLNRLIIREISKDKSLDDKYMSNMYITQSILTIISWSILAAFVLLTNFDNSSKSIILIIGTYQILYKLTQLVDAQFKAHEDMVYCAFLDIFHKIIILLFGSIAIITFKDPVITLLIYPISAASMLLIGLIISFKKYGRPNFELDIPFIKSLIVKAFPFLVLLVLVQFYDRIGIILLTVFQGDEATGIYAAIDRLIITIITAISMFGAALFPVMSRFAKDSHDKLITTHENAIRIIVICILPISTFLFLLSELIILTLYGDTFREAAKVLQIMSWAILPSGLNVIMSGILIATDQQNKVVKIEFIMISGFIIACLAFIPEYSYIGLAYAKLFTSLALCLTYSWYLSRIYHCKPLITQIKAPLIACTLTAIMFELTANLSLWLSILVALITCVLALLLTGAIKQHDIAYVKRILLSR